jgi:hypothetical protein
MIGPMNGPIARTAARLGLATRKDVGRVKAAIGAVAMVEREGRDLLEERVDDLEARLERLEGRHLVRSPSAPAPDVASIHHGG